MHTAKMNYGKHLPRKYGCRCKEIYEELMNMYGAVDATQKNVIIVSDNSLPDAKDVFGEGIVWYDKENRAHRDYIRKTLRKCMLHGEELEDTTMLDNYGRIIHCIYVNCRTWLYIYNEDFMKFVDEIRRSNPRGWMPCAKYNKRVKLDDYRKDENKD